MDSLDLRLNDGVALQWPAGNIGLREPGGSAVDRVEGRATGRERRRIEMQRHQPLSAGMFVGDLMDFAMFPPQYFACNPTTSMNLPDAPP